MTPERARFELLVAEDSPTDILPKRDGEDILKRLRSTVVMTSADSSSVEEKAMKHAALGCFRKPSKLDRFLQLGLIVRRIRNGEEEGSPIAAERRKDARGNG
ncbi:MAG TPA: hypothetical protein VNV86_04565 [Candidatus Acidoferrum sp.]|nr:hypothetical protein [Candidatus Acidoferrum sp.]